MMTAVTRIERMREEDLEAVLTLATGFGWKTGPARLSALLAHDPGGSFVVRGRGGEPVATVMTTRYAASAWISYLMVSPTEGRLGLGTALLERALAHLDSRGAPTVRLDADPPGVRIYRRYGFAERYVSRRFLFQPAPAASAPPRHGAPEAEPAGLPPGVSRLTAAGLDEAAACDREAFGDDRSRLLALLHERAEAAFCMRSGGRLAGFALLVPHEVGLQLGPWICPDPGAAEPLLAAALAHAGDRSVTAGLPAPNEEAARLLLAHGFEERPPSLRMRRGADGTEGRPDRVFGIVCGAAG